MKKVANIPYSDMNRYPWGNFLCTPRVQLNRKKRRLNPEWIEQTLTPAQAILFDRHRIVAREHPTQQAVELFVDESELTDSDLMYIRLAFSK